MRDCNYLFLKHRASPALSDEVAVWRDVLEKTRDMVLSQTVLHEAVPV